MRTLRAPVAPTSATPRRRLVLAAVATLALVAGLLGAGAGTAQAATVMPHGKIYLAYNADISESGIGTGYSSYINVHDAYSDALAFGIQSDTGSTVSKGQPRFIWERVQNGKFTYAYLSLASHNLTDVTIRWYQNNVAVLMVGKKNVAIIPMVLKGREFYNAEGNARLNGDTVHSSVRNISITVGSQPSQTGIIGTWNTGFTFHGLKATAMNTAKEQGASFWINGRVSGLPRGGNWDSTEVAGIAMIAQRW